MRKYRPCDLDIVATCAYPFTHWALGRRGRGKRPKRVFITQNGDWPAYSDDSEFRFFACDGLVCTNPDYFERNNDRYRCALIPNGVDLDRFHPGESERARFGLPEGPVILMVSALIPSKNVAQGLAAVAQIPGATLVVAGDGPLRDDIRQRAEELMPGRYLQLSVAAREMPVLYRSADVFMHLSRDESFGNVFLEALASGIPIVAYDTPRTRWILGEAAILAKDGETEALLDALRRALEVAKNPAGQVDSRAKRFAWGTIAKEYERFFGELEENSAV